MTASNRAAGAAAPQTRGPSATGCPPRPIAPDQAEGPRPKPSRRRPRDIGTDAERAVVRYLRATGWPHAERRALRGAFDAGDITGTPGLCWEVKGGDAARRASDERVAAWLADTEAERVNAGADVGVLVVQRPGIGPANAGRWWAILRYVAAYGVRSGGVEHLTPERWTDADAAPVRMLLADAVELLRTEGYGEPLSGVAP